MPIKLEGFAGGDRTAINLPAVQEDLLKALSATGKPLVVVLQNGSALANAAILTRRFDFPPEPVAVLLRRLQSQVQDEGEAPAQSRLAARKAAAQTMLALGLGPEAQALLRLAVADDPVLE